MTAAKKQKAPSEPEIASARQLAELVNRSHSTIADWLRRADWPFAPMPPWPRKMLGHIEAWVESLGNRSEHVEGPSVVHVPGRFTVTPEMLRGTESGFDISQQLGMNACSVREADYEWLAKLLTCVIIDVMIDTGETGRDGAIAADASPAYYKRLWKLVMDRDPGLRQLEERMENASEWWLEQCVSGNRRWERRAGKPQEKLV